MLRTWVAMNGVSCAPSGEDRNGTWAMPSSLRGSGLVSHGGGMSSAMAFSMRSGCSEHRIVVTNAPQSWPMSRTFCRPSASRIATTSWARLAFS
jgi:hypothetical protein